MRTFTESIVEDASLAWLEALGYAVLHGPASNDWLAVNQFTAAEGRHVNQAVAPDGVQPWKVG